MNNGRTPSWILIGFTAVAAAVSSSRSAATLTDDPAAAAAIRRLEQPRDPSAAGLASRTLAQLLQDHGTPAVSIAVVKDYKIAWARAWGQADAESGRPADTGTLFQAASISKPVATMGVLRAVQDGKFGLDDDINKLLKSWKLIQDRQFIDKTTVTPRLLMSMTAGATIGGFPGYLPTDPLPTVPQILGYDGAGRTTPANTKPVTIAWEPNTKYEYSGGGVTILQLAVSKEGLVSGVWFNRSTNKSAEVEGQVDPDTQRAAIRRPEQPDVVLEVGVYNLTQNASPCLMHFGTVNTQTWYLARLDNPAAAQR